MSKYRKKPVVIDAIQWDCTEESFQKILNLKSNRMIEWPEGSRHLFIHTLEGIMEASVGDFIIKGVDGESYPCKPDIFAKTYEKVE